MQVPNLTVAQQEVATITEKILYDNLLRLCDLLNFLDTGGDNVDASAFGNRDADDFGELWTPDDCNTNSLFKEGDGAADGDVFGSEFNSNNEL